MAFGSGAGGCSYSSSPLCKFCADRGLVVRAAVVDHVEPHRGDWNKFVLGPLQSLCATCHNSTKQKLEQVRPGVDADGWPLDHPVDKQRMRG